MKSILIAAPSSGSGKTTISLGIMVALRRKGLVVQPFKVGPDFIDPGHHAVVCGRASRNLDGWMLSQEYIAESFQNACHPDPLPSRERERNMADIAVIEGVMGLFDGASGGSEDGSSAQIAKWTGTPVILVIDARSMARSAAALVSGFENFDSGVNIAGVIFNRVGSDRHRKMLRDAVESNCKAKVLGFIPRDEGLAMPERHLGLVTAEEGLSAEFIDRLAKVIEDNVDLDGLMSVSGTVPILSGGTGFQPVMTGKMPVPLNLGQSPSMRIAVARDQAFSFYYEDNLDILRNFGAELAFFSPLADKSLPEGATSLYIGGGYPEVHAERLSANRPMLDSIRGFAESGGKVYAECGGFMYLTEGIVDFNERFHPMAGIFPTRAKMLKRRKALGYVEVEALEDCPLAIKGSVIKGHEFHYSEVESMPESIIRAYRVGKPNSNEAWAEGYGYKNTLASYVHLHFGSNPEWAKGLIDFTTKAQRTQSNYFQA